MSFRKSIVYLARHLREKHRFSIRNQHTDREVWYMHISPLNLFAGFVALVLVLFVLITSLIAYTPVLDMIPGYPGSKSRLMLINNIMRLDSLEQEVRNMQIYSENISLIMAGKSPVTGHSMQELDSLSRARGTTVYRILEDSVLRSELEATGGSYSLSDPALARRNLRSAMDLFVPVRGVVSEKFNPRLGNYGTKLATKVNQEVMAVSDGTVIAAGWSPDDGFAIYIQHGNNLISVYRHTVQTLKKAGDHVYAGEVIAYTGSSASDLTGKNLFEFELWYNGSPIDPEGYITF